MATTIKEFVVVLDAGHGPGKASNRGSLIGNEGDNNYAYSLVLKAEFEKYEGVKVILTRPNNHDYPTLKQRGAMGKGADLLLSLHSNAFRDKYVNGMTVFDSVARPNIKLAKAILKSLSVIFKPRRVVYKKNSKGTDWYDVLRYSQAKSSMMLEHGFHTNLSDCKKYVERRPEIAKITAEVIAKHYGLKLKPKPVPEPVKPDIPATLPSEPFLPRTRTIEVVTKKEITEVPIGVLNKDTKMWNFNVNSWSEITEVKAYSKGTKIELGDAVINPMGRKYIRPKYSMDKGIYRGFHVNDIDIKYKEV